MNQRNAVIVYLLDEGNILLAKSNYRQGKITWNGISGYIEKHESPEQAAIRELYEEIKVRVYESDLEKAGVIHHKLLKNNALINDFSMTIFTCRRWQGEPTITPGIVPQWYSYEDIPYTDMFDDDKEWLPKVLDHEQVIVEVVSTEDDQTGEKTITSVSVRDILG